ncbi:hypothetical protein QOT17_020005 [Balamuthia mandrillaris]
MHTRRHCGSNRFSWSSSPSFWLGCVWMLGVWALVVQSAVGEEARRYDTDLSFAPPFATAEHPPGWSVDFKDGVTNKYIELVTMQHKSGGLWANNPMNSKNWEVELEFQTGPQPSAPLNFAVWLVQEPQRRGPLSGYRNKWDGLGIFFTRHSPQTVATVSAVFNDGTRFFNPGFNPAIAGSGSCEIPAQYLPASTGPKTETKTKATITYDEGLLQVSLTSPRSRAPLSCFSVELAIPNGLFFGITASKDETKFFTFETETWGANNDELYVEEEEEVLEAYFVPNEEPEEDTQNTLEADLYYDEIIQDEQQQQQEEEVKAPKAARRLRANNPLKPRDQPVETVEEEVIQEATGDNDALELLAMRIEELFNSQTSVMNTLTSIQRQLGSLPARSKNVEEDEETLFDEAYEKVLASVSDTKELLESSLPSIRDQLANAHVALQAGSTYKLQEAIKDLKTNMQRTRQVYEYDKLSQERLVTDLAQQKEKLLDAVQGSSSGSWFYFIFFQMCFVAVMAWWLKSQKQPRVHGGLGYYG